MKQVFPQSRSIQPSRVVTNWWSKPLRLILGHNYQHLGSVERPAKARINDKYPVISMNHRAASSMSPTFSKKELGGLNTLLDHMAG